MSFISSIADVIRYQQTRFPLVRFVPLALFLTLAAAPIDELPTVERWLRQALLVVPWLLQFRLLDDLADLPRDRCAHPHRVLVRAPLVPFVVLLLILMMGNVLVAWIVLPRWRDLLVLTALFLLGYSAYAVWRPLRLVSSMIVLLKYPAFVYLLSDPRFDTGLATLGLMTLVYACSLAYECLHDDQFQTTAGTIALALALLAMTAAALLPALLRPIDCLLFGWLLPGCAVLVWVFTRHCRRRAAGVWPNAVFIVGSSWVVFAYLVPVLGHPMALPPDAVTTLLPSPVDFETVRCLGCGADDAVPFITAEDDLTGKPGQFTFVRCRRCSLVYQNPRLNVERIKDYYDDEYIAHRKKTRWGFLTPLYRRAMEDHDRRKERIVSRHVNLDNASEVLDVGCGAATFVQRLRRLHGARITGVDFKDLSMLPGFSELEFRCGLFYTQDWGERPFDLITMWHFLEHDYEPLRTLRLAASLLKAQGRLVIEVPRLDSVSFRLYRKRWPGLQAPQHTALYTRETFLRCLAAAGLEVVEYLPFGAFPAYFYLFAGAAFKVLRGRGLNPSLAIYPYFAGQLLLAPLLLFERRLNLAMQTAICRRAS